MGANEPGHGAYQQRPRECTGSPQECHPSIGTRGHLPSDQEETRRVRAQGTDGGGASIGAGRREASGNEHKGKVLVRVEGDGGERSNSTIGNDLARVAPFTFCIGRAWLA